MESKKITEFNDDELVGASGSTVVGTEAGRKAQHAQAELIRRLMQTIRNADQTTTKYSKVMVAFTFILFVIAMLQLVVAIFSSKFDPWIQVCVVFVSLAVLGWVFRNLDREFFKNTEEKGK